MYDDPEQHEIDMEEIVVAKPKTIAEGSMVTVAELANRGWAMGEVDKAVKDGILTQVGVRGYRTNKELY